MSKAQILRRLPKDRPLRPRRRAALEALLDFRKLRNAAWLESLLFLRSIRSELVEAARDAYARRSPEGIGTLFDVAQTAAGKIQAHLRRVAELYVAMRVVARIEVREEAELPLRSAVASAAVFAQGALGNVSPVRAVEYLRSLDVLTRAEWEAAIARQRAQAFFISGVEQRILLDQMKELIAASLESGLTPRQFERSAFELLRNFEVAPSRLRTVWNTNVAKALNEGRRAELADPEVAAVISFGLFDSMNDSFTRPGHEALDNGIAPMTWWNGAGAQFYPPLEWNCRCVVLGITAARASRLLASGPPYKDLTQEIPLGATRRILAERERQAA